MAKATMKKAETGHKWFSFRCPYCGDPDTPMLEEEGYEGNEIKCENCGETYLAGRAPA